MQIMGRPAADLFPGLGIKQDPADFDDLGGVLGDVDAMLVAGRRNMDDYVAVDVVLLIRRGRHLKPAPSGRDGSRGGGRKEERSRTSR